MKRALALALALAAGCVRAPPPDLSRDPAGLLEQVRSAQSRVRSIRGAARISVESRVQSGSFDAWLAAEKPERVRIEALDFFGNPAAVLVARRGHFSLLDLKARVYYRGEATPENLARLLPVSVPVADLATMLCGSAPLVGSAAAAVPDGDAMRLDLLGNEGREVLWIGEGATVRAASWEPRAGSASSSWRVTFDAFRASGGMELPAEADLRSAAGQVTLHWESGAEVNLTANAAIFSLEPPAGVRIVDVEGGVAPALGLPAGPAQGAGTER